MASAVSAAAAAAAAAPAKSLASKVALVTGGANGLGVAFAKCLLDRGAKVGLVDIADGRSVARSFNEKYGSGRAAFFRANVTDFGQLHDAFDAVEAKFGNIHVVFNNAGIAAEGLDRAHEMVAINLSAVIEGTKIAVQRMKAHGEGGVVVNTASMAGLMPLPPSPVYAGTKAAVVSFSRSLGMSELVGNVRVNALCPSFADTAIVADIKEKWKSIFDESGGLMTAEYVAENAMKLVDDEDLSGAVLAVHAKKGPFFVHYDPRSVFPRSSKL